MLSKYLENAVLGRLETMQFKCFFRPARTTFLAVLWEYIFYNVDRNVDEVRKIREVF